MKNDDHALSVGPGPAGAPAWADDEPGIGLVDLLTWIGRAKWNPIGLANCTPQQCSK